MSTIDISHINKAALLAELYNRSQPLGMGMLHYTPQDMTEEQAQTLLGSQMAFDYLAGRVMKVDLSGDSLSTRGYDRDNGQGAAQAAVDAVWDRS